MTEHKPKSDVWGDVAKQRVTSSASSQMLPTPPKISSFSQIYLTQAASSSPLHSADEGEPIARLTSCICGSCPALVPTREAVPPVATEKHLPEEYQHVRAAHSPRCITDSPSTSFT